MWMPRNDGHIISGMKIQRPRKVDPELFQTLKEEALKTMRDFPVFIADARANAPRNCSRLGEFLGVKLNVQRNAMEAAVREALVELDKEAHQLRRGTPPSHFDRLRSRHPTTAAN